MLDSCAPFLISTKFPHPKEHRLKLELDFGGFLGLISDWGEILQDSNELLLLVDFHTKVQPLASVLPKPMYLSLMLRLIGVQELNVICLLSPFLNESCKLTKQHILLLDSVQPGIVMDYDTGEEDGGQSKTEHDNPEPSTDHHSLLSPLTPVNLTKTVFFAS